MTEIKPFQYAGAKAIYRFRGRALLGDEMGLGKTLQALLWLRNTPNRRPAIIVCPASMKYTWQAEALLHFNMRTEVLEGNRKSNQPLPGDIVILNYDILASWLPLLIRNDPACVILDEIHFIKSLTAKRTRAALKLTENVPSVIGLSGTPLTSRPIELWTVLKAIRPDLFPDLAKYAFRYCAPRYTFWGWKYDGATRLKELHRVLREECLIRRLKKDVLPELPPKTRRMVPFRLSSYTEYNHAKDDFIRWLRKSNPGKVKKAKRAEAVVKLGYLVRLSAKLKLEWTEKWIADFFASHPGEKLVCFTMHTFVINRLRDKFPDRCVIIDGRERGRKREEAVRQFRSHRKKDLLLGNWIAAGVGITLTAAANAVALDLPWTPGELMQGEDRIYRIGQKKDVTMYYLIALDTIEEKQMQILKRKSKILGAVLDGKRTTKDTNIFNELIENIKEE